MDYLCFVDRVSAYNLVNKPTWYTIFFLVYLYLSISTCFGMLWAHQQEIQLCLCGTQYLFFCMDDWYAPGWFIYKVIMGI